MPGFRIMEMRISLYESMKRLVYRTQKKEYLEYNSDYLVKHYDKDYNVYYTKGAYVKKKKIIYVSAHLFIFNLSYILYHFKYKEEK